MFNVAHPVCPIEKIVPSDRPVHAETAPRSTGGRASAARRASKLPGDIAQLIAAIAALPGLGTVLTAARAGVRAGRRGIVAVGLVVRRWILSVSRFTLSLASTRTSLALAWL